MASGELLGVLMLVAMISVIFIGFPISFTLLFIALVFGSIGMGAELTFNLAYLQIWAMMKDDILPAAPLFIFMGYMAEQGGLMQALFRTSWHILAPLPGALYLTVLVTATIFAMSTGIVGAAVTVLGIMAGPMMLKAGYDARLSAGTIAAGGTLGILIPPSVMLIIMGPILGVPVNQLYAAAFFPGFLLAGVYIVWCLVRSFMNPKLGPPMPAEERIRNPWRLLREFLVGVVPLLVLITATLGTILAGLATATESAGCGAVGATLLALAYRKLTWKGLKEAARSTLLATSMVLFLAVASAVFGAVFTKLGGASVVSGLVLNLPLPDFGKLLVIMLLIFILGWPFEWPAIVLVFLPLFMPVVENLQLGLGKRDLLLVFGVLVAVNLQTAYLSPPVAMSAYYLRNVMPAWSLRMIYGGMMQFMVLQVVCLVALLMWPQIILWAPRALAG